MSLGTLYLIPVPLSETADEATFTLFAKQIMHQVDEYIVENAKTARKFLKLAGTPIPQNKLILHDYGKHARQQADKSFFFKGLLAGKDVGLMSEAGCPGIADPGAEIVAEAHRLGVKVVPLVGPSSIVLALMASGFNGQSFAFQGYLPIDKAARNKKLKQLETTVRSLEQTQIFIETPFRNNQLLEEIIRACSPNTRLCIACNLTAPNEWIASMPLSKWKGRDIDLHKKPAIFLMGS
ncbi:SAM-dependent methyltransferase [Olivibacter sitiensis]|uniref:SAM-dependent methyltransferase n=1 Tax=Olivibacter sitiensis TaxID=376470 RepID=UPI0004887133|nr:SAM-dependent methyltransferase [Olivibacter sitiensis]